MADLKTRLEPFRRIREAVGDRIEIRLEGYGYWDITTAKKIAAAVEDYQPAWLKDMVLAHDVNAIAELKASTSTPVIASEMLITRFQYRQLLERRAADIVMVDPTWAGGITDRGGSSPSPSPSGCRSRCTTARDRSRCWPGSTSL